MTAYNHHTFQDFLADDYFRTSTLSPTAETNQFWKEWTQQNPPNISAWQQARQAVLLLEQGRNQYTSQTLSDAHVESLWERLQQTIETPTTPLVTVVHHNQWYRSWRFAASVAASLLLIGVSLYVWQESQPDQIEMRTAYGQTRSVTLPDGSQVMLNANTTLRYAANWQSDADRHTYLNGEAFFQVTHLKNNARFVVHTGDLDVEVLGTKFNVSTRRDQMRVTLEEGRVKVNELVDNHQSLIMQPGETVEWSTQGRQLAKRVVPIERYDAWTQKRFVFDETPLPEVAQMLEDNFGLTVQISNPALLTKTLSGEIALDNEQMLLQALHDLYGLKISREGQTIILR